MIEEQEEDRWIHEWMRSGRPISALATAMIGAVGTVAITFAGPIEGFLFPVFTGNDIPLRSVTREGDKLCWTRVGLKARDVSLTDIDADVDYISSITHKLAHQPTPEILDAESGDPVTTDDMVPVGIPFELRRCLRLSSHILPGQPVRLRQIAYYQSPTGLYNVPVTVPTIILPADKGWVFSQKHDTAPTPADNAVAGPPPPNYSHATDAPPANPPDLGKDIVHSPHERRPDGGTFHRMRYDVPLDDFLQDDDGLNSKTHMDTTLSAHDAARVEQSRVEHGDRSRRAALRRLIPRALDDEDRDALGPYEPGRR